MEHCNLCGRVVRTDEYRVLPRPNKPNAQGITVCADCLHGSPRCAVCQTPMSQKRAAIGICADCLAEGLHCRACGAALRGDYVLINGADGPYCENCMRTRAACDLCGAPVGARVVTYAVGRLVCARCHQTTIGDPREAEALFERVIDLLGTSLGLYLNIRPRLVLVDRARMMELARVAMSENGHGREKALGLFVRNGRKRFIYLQEFLPRIMLIQVAAHEFAHAWQGENCPLLSNPQVREGFAEWAAYHVLLQLDAPKKATQMLKRADDYGEGLRELLQVERQHGAAGVLQYCRASVKGER